MSITVKGICRNGQIVLLEKLEGLDEGTEVVVTFPDAEHGVQDAASREARRQSAMKWLRETGWHLGGPPYPRRDEPHDRAR